MSRIRRCTRRHLVLLLLFVPALSYSQSIIEVAIAQLEQSKELGDSLNAIQQSVDGLSRKQGSLAEEQKESLLGIQKELKKVAEAHSSMAERQLNSLLSIERALNDRSSTVPLLLSVTTLFCVSVGMAALWFRAGEVKTSNQLLRQLLRAYGHDPEM